MTERDGHARARMPAALRLCGEFVDRALACACMCMILVYRVTLSPIMGGQCRFEPTCSRYALEAYRTHNVLHATSLTVRRVLRCHPFTKGGYDPVPVPENRP